MEELRLAEECLGDVLQGRMPSWSVLTLLVSRVIGYCIVLGASITKVPQIVTVIKNKSAEGLSLISFELELVATVLHTSYGLVHGLPLAAYGEAAVMFLQSVVLNTVIYIFQNTRILRPVTIYTAISLGTLWVFTGRVSVHTIDYLYDFNQAIFCMSRGTQIWANYKQGHTGQLSIITYGMFSFGCVMRVLTSLREGAGVTMVRGFILGVILNTTVFLQIVNSTLMKNRKTKTGKED